MKLESGFQTHFRTTQQILDPDGYVLPKNKRAPNFVEPVLTRREVRECEVPEPSVCPKHTCGDPPFPVCNSGKVPQGFSFGLSISISKDRQVTGKIRLLHFLSYGFSTIDQGTPPGRSEPCLKGELGFIRATPVLPPFG